MLKKPELKPFVVPPLDVLKKPELMSPVFPKPERLALIESHQVEMPLVDLSSREMRSRLARGLSIRYRTPRAVEKYIEARGLYRP